MWRYKIALRQRLNNQITAPEVFLISENGRAYGKVSLDQALFLAYDKGIDLLEINPSIQPPVCKLQDYGKFLYERSKQIQKQRAKQKNSELKEIKLSINIGDHDLKVKEKRALEFINSGDKVKIFMVLRGREMMFKDKVKDVMNRFKDDIGLDFAEPVNYQGNRFSVMLKKK